MSPERKAMKIVSLLFILWGLIAGVYTILTIIEAANFGWDITGILVSLVMLVQPILGFLIVGYGVKGSTTPSKASPFNALCIVLALFEVCFFVVGGAIAYALQTEAFWVDSWGVGIALVGFVLALAGFSFGNKVYKASLK